MSVDPSLGSTTSTRSLNRPTDSTAAATNSPVGNWYWNDTPSTLTRFVPRAAPELAVSGVPKSWVTPGFIVREPVGFNSERSFTVGFASNQPGLVGSSSNDFQRASVLSRGVVDEWSV